MRQVRPGNADARVRDNQRNAFRFSREGYGDEPTCLAVLESIVKKDEQQATERTFIGPDFTLHVRKIERDVNAAGLSILRKSPGCGPLRAPMV